MAQTPFFGAKPAPAPIQVLDVNGFKVEINLPPALKSQSYGGAEVELSLPPYARTPGFSVDSIDAPSNFERSNGITKSFVFGVRPNTGLWLDFNRNSENSHDVAVVISAQGINAITGKKTDSFTLEQFAGGTPPQNYLCSTGSPYGGFWLDGFMAADGVVRQWVFTEDLARGVARNVIGDQAVQAIGLAFYQSRALKPRPAFRGTSRGLESLESMTLGASSTRSFSPKSIDVAAGARIKQRVDRDPQHLSHWEQSPSAVMILYYVADQELSAMVAGNRRPQEDGFLTGMPTGN